MIYLGVFIMGGIAGATIMAICAAQDDSQWEKEASKEAEDVRS